MNQNPRQPSSAELELSVKKLQERFDRRNREVLLLSVGLLPVFTLNVVGITSRFPQLEILLVVMMDVFYCLAYVMMLLALHYGRLLLAVEKEEKEKDITRKKC